MVGRTLVATGLLLLGFVAYQLWGTAIQTARAQSSLQSEFDDLLALAGPVPSTVATTEPAPDPDDPVVGTIERPPSQTLPVPGAPGATVPGDTVPGATVPGETVPPIEPTVPTTPPPTAPPGLVPAGAGPAPGDPVVRLEIPRLGLEQIVVSGVDTSSLRKGPGHYPDMAFPGEAGNAGIAGHRTTYGAPFEDLDKLDPGDEIITTTPAGRFVYRVRSQTIVAPEDSYVLADTGAPVLTLTTCHPRFSTAQRLIVVADLQAEESDAALAPGLTAGWFGPGGGPPVPDTVPPPVSPTAVPGDPADPADPGAGGPAAGTDVPATSAVATSVVAAGSEADPDQPDSLVVDAFSAGWFSDPAAWPHVGLWGAALTAVGLLAWGVSRWSRHNWVGALVFVGPFLFVLYFFYENVARLLPPNL
jgi:sortase A